jgi:hypothetical protein
MLNMPASASGISRNRQSWFVIFMIFSSRENCLGPGFGRADAIRSGRGGARGGPACVAAHAVNILQTVKAVYSSQ